MEKMRNFFGLRMVLLRTEDVKNLREHLKENLFFWDMLSKRAILLINAVDFFALGLA